MATPEDRRLFQLALADLYDKNPFFRQDKHAANNLFAQAFRQSVLLSPTYPQPSRGAYLLRVPDGLAGLGRLASSWQQLASSVKWMTHDALVAARGASLETCVGPTSYRRYQEYNPFSQYCVLIVVRLRTNCTLVSLAVRDQTWRDDCDPVGFVNRHILSCQDCHPFSGGSPVQFRGSAYPCSTLLQPQPLTMQLLETDLRTCPHCRVFYTCRDKSHDAARHRHERECAERLAEIQASGLKRLEYAREALQGVYLMSYDEQLLSKELDVNMAEVKEEEAQQSEERESQTETERHRPRRKDVDRQRVLEFHLLRKQEPELLENCLTSVLMGTIPSSQLESMLGNLFPEAKKPEAPPAAAAPAATPTEPFHLGTTRRKAKKKGPAAAKRARTRKKPVVAEPPDTADLPLVR